MPTMALTVPNSISFLKFPPQKTHFRFSPLPPTSFPYSSFRSLKFKPLERRLICAAASAAGSSSSDGYTNPYEILGVRSIEGFHKIKLAYRRRRKEAEERGDKDTAYMLEKAYDKIMMEQLTKRKKGETFGTIKISKEIKYADRLPLIPWAPRFLKSDIKDMQINLALSAAFAAWIIFRPGDEWKPLQFLFFVFFYRIFEKLKSFEPSASPTFTEFGEDEGRAIRMGKRLLRSLGLVFGCVALTSLMYTGTVNLLEFTAGSLPAVIQGIFAYIQMNQAILVTVGSSLSLCYLSSFYC